LNLLTVVLSKMHDWKGLQFGLLFCPVVALGLVLLSFLCSYQACCPNQTWFASKLYGVVSGSSRRQCCCGWWMPRRGIHSF
jgi:hypothetical protein